MSGMYQSLHGMHSLIVQIQMEKWSEALEILGEDNPFRADNVFQGEVLILHLRQRY